MAVNRLKFPVEVLHTLTDGDRLISTDCLLYAQNIDNKQTYDDKCRLVFDDPCVLDGKSNETFANYEAFSNFKFGTLFFDIDDTLFINIGKVKAISANDKNEAVVVFSDTVKVNVPNYTPMQLFKKIYYF